MFQLVSFSVIALTASASSGEPERRTSVEKRSTSAHGSSSVIVSRTCCSSCESVHLWSMRCLPPASITSLAKALYAHGWKLPVRSDLAESMAFEEAVDDAVPGYRILA